MQTTETLTLNVLVLPLEARKAFRLPKIMHNLIAVAELCDAGSRVSFDKEEVHVAQDNTTLL
eukprot:12221973-Ditylum_brightwellii.AAC.1